MRICQYRDKLGNQYDLSNFITKLFQSIFGNYQNHYTSWNIEAAEIKFKLIDIQQLIYLILKVQACQFN